MSDRQAERGVQVLYDGQCRFCRRSVELATKLDWFGRLAYVDVRDEDESLLSDPRLVAAPLLEQMHVLTPGGRLYAGYRAIRALAWRLPLLWPVAPLLYLPGMTWLGQKLYLWVARHRFDLVPCQHGVCTIKRKQTDERPA